MPVPVPTADDPHVLRFAASRLSLRSRRAGALPLTVMAVLLEEGEVVDVVAQGRYREVGAAVALTDRRVLLVSERELAPDVTSVPLTATLAVQGWQDDKVAALVFTDGAVAETFDRIADRPLAMELAQRLRARVGEIAAGH